MVLPICHRVTYWRNCAPVTAAAAAAAPRALRSATFIVTVSVPLADRLSLLPVRSRPATPVPPMTGYSASPPGSFIPETGALPGSPASPLTGLPDRPGPPFWRAMVITGAPGWSASELVPYQTGSDRPGPPAAIHGNTFTFDGGWLTWTGVAHCAQLVAALATVVKTW